MSEPSEWSLFSCHGILLQLWQVFHAQVLKYDQDTGLFDFCISMQITYLQNLCSSDADSSCNMQLGDQLLGLPLDSAPVHYFGDFLWISMTGKGL